MGSVEPSHVFDIASQLVHKSKVLYGRIRSRLHGETPDKSRNRMLGKCSLYSYRFKHAPLGLTMERKEPALLNIVIVLFNIHSIKNIEKNRTVHKKGDGRGRGAPREGGRRSLGKALARPLSLFSSAFGLRPRLHVGQGWSTGERRDRERMMARDRCVPGAQTTPPNIRHPSENCPHSTEAIASLILPMIPSTSILFPDTPIPSMTLPRSMRNSQRSVMNRPSTGILTYLSSTRKTTLGIGLRYLPRVSSKGVMSLNSTLALPCLKLIRISFLVFFEKGISPPLHDLISIASAVM